jgi:hypothetical protein
VIRVLELLTATTLGGGPRQVLDLVDISLAKSSASRSPAAGCAARRDLRTVGVELSPVDWTRSARFC